MVTTLPTKQSQFLRPIPTIRQKIDFTRDGESKGLEHPFGQGDFGLKGSTSFGPFRMIEFCPQRQKKVFIKQGKEDPLVTKDIGLLSMIPMPGTSWNLFACLLGEGVIDNQKENGMGFDPQGMEELIQSGLCDLLHGPDVVPQESGEARKRSVQKAMGKGLNHRRSVELFAQLDEGDDKGGENLERRS
jgi:hypothetical protein